MFDGQWFGVVHFKSKLNEASKLFYNCWKSTVCVECEWVESFVAITHISTIVNHHEVSRVRFFSLGLSSWFFTAFSSLISQMKKSLPREELCNQFFLFATALELKKLVRVESRVKWGKIVKLKLSTFATFIFYAFVAASTRNNYRASTSWIWLQLRPLHSTNQSSLSEG